MFCSGSWRQNPPISRSIDAQKPLRTATERWIEQIMECAPLSLYARKEAALRGLEVPLWEAVGQTFQMAEKLYASEDFIAGPEAFAEKRKPDWKGR